jgi:hypothetical protein
MTHSNEINPANEIAKLKNEYHYRKQYAEEFKFVFTPEIEAKLGDTFYATNVGFLYVCNGKVEGTPRWSRVYPFDPVFPEESDENNYDGECG